jgi:hypothetical protein
MRKFYWQIGSIVTLLVINTFWSIEPAKACSCYYPNSLQDAMNRSSRTFIGKVLSFKKDNESKDGWTATLAVSRVWKGKRQSRITVHTSRPRPPGCRSGFIIGEEYLVFSDSYENINYTSICSGTSLLEDFSPVEIRTLGKGRIVR